MPRSPAVPEPARMTRRDEQKSATRQRLLEAAIEILLREGEGHLTTGKIAKGAGIHQTGFYVHFKNIDECLRAVAERVTRALIDLDTELRRTRMLTLRDEQRLEDTIDRMRIVLEFCMRDRRAAEIYVRCRLEGSVLGEALRQAIARSLALVTEDLWDLAVASGLRGSHMREIEVMANLLVVQFSGALELLVTQPDQRVDAVAAAIGASQYHYVRGEILRMLAAEAANK